MENEEVEWYVIRCVGGQERKAKKYIELELKIQNCFLRTHIGLETAKSPSSCLTRNTKYLTPSKSTGIVIFMSEPV